MLAKAKIDSLIKLPSVAAYFDRVGAAGISLRRAAVYEFDGQYRRDAAQIRFTPDGTITAKEGYEPTDKEQADIKAEWATCEWPKHVPALTLNTNPPPEWANAKADELFVVRAREKLPGQDKKYSEPPILMVHQLVPKEDGNGKDYWCWTFYDDDQWRLAEPPDGLPLYGLENLSGKTTVFIHEGAKAARDCKRRLEEGNLPWADSLNAPDTAHLGWLGGAYAMHKTDFEELEKAGVRRVYIVADNDVPGKAAIPKISKRLSAFDITVMAVQFTDDFPVGFDLGDRFPDKLFKKGKEKGNSVYVGPSFAELTRPATWATAPNPVAAQVGRGRPPKPTYHVREMFSQEWWMAKTDKAPLFINRHHREKLFTEQAFATMTRAVADCPTLDLFKAQAFARTVDCVAYEPGKQTEIIVEGQRAINTWVPSRVKAAQNAEPEEWSFWEKFMEHLFPVATERHEAMRWIATLVARPQWRMVYALLLYSEGQGVGKTTLCEIIRVLVGEHNSQCPTASSIIKSQFNGWIVRKRFIYVNEIYESGNLEAYTILKTYITDPNIRANEKMIPEYMVANWAHFIFCSNSTAPLAVEDGDRRIFVPTVTEELKPKEWWQEFYGQLSAGGHEAIAAWAEWFVSQPGGEVEGGARAPYSERKARLIDDSRSWMDRTVRDLAEAARTYVRKVDGLVGAVLVTTDVEKWLSEKFPKNKLPPQAVLRKWLKDAGMWETGKRLKVDGQAQYVFVPRADLAAADGWPELKDYRVLPGTLFSAQEPM